MKKIVSVLLAVAICLGLISFDYKTEAATDNENAEASIRAQIEDLAKSIDKKNADDDAARALAKHGISGGGKKLSVGKSHVLTATLLNSEVIKAALSEVCAQSIAYMQTLGEKALYLDLHSSWNTFGYYYEIYRDLEKTAPQQLLRSKGIQGLSGNAYDTSLTWMAGSTATDLEIKERAVTTDTVTYDVKLRVWDRFDFHTSTGSGFKDFISGIGALLFREYDWESTVSFQIKVPNVCDHSAKNYHWTMDRETREMHADTSDGFSENQVILYEHQESNGNFRYYYKLSQTVHLMHDKPWVLEMQTVNPKTIFLNAIAKGYDFYPGLMLHGRMYFCARKYRRLEVSETSILAHTDCYGTALRPNFSFVSDYPYTLIVENEIAEDGSNMLYLTVYNSAGGVSLKRTPLDDHYFSDTKGISHQLMETEDVSVSGMDFRINYIGNGTNDFYGNSFGFYADAFDLKIWENGKDDEGDFLTKKVTKPTCSARGYTTYTCELCGYSYKSDYTAKLSHKYDSETDGDCNLCGEVRFTRGDLNGDHALNSADAIYLLRHSIMAKAYPVSQSADVNGDGTVNSADAIYLLRHIIMPKEYPLT